MKLQCTLYYGKKVRIVKLDCPNYDSIRKCIEDSLAETYDRMECREII